MATRDEPPGAPGEEQDVVGRGGLKLEAAIGRFGLAPRLAGARAIDIGASTGGFTQALLRHGCAGVTAVDVGRGQLHPSLATDPRVENLEGVHFRTLALSIAPGPYDFFSVDVSFVAARTMLRGLAFRLRPGAEGVVLVKPQFELPDQKVKGGNVTAPQLRERALEAVRERAEALGFELVEAVDSPVAGGSGTVEMLAHLRFKGRSEKLPQPGERRRASDEAPRSARGQLPSLLRLFAVAAPGLEEAVRAELAALPGARQVTVEPGGVSFTGDVETCLRANLCLRVATRVLVRLGELEAREFSRLRRGAARLPFAAVTPPGAALALHVSQTRSRLYHTGAIAETLALSVADALGMKELPLAPKAKGDGDEAEAPAGPLLGVWVRGVADHWTVSVDSSGALLHRRGWRLEGAHAPLRETLAAGVLTLLGWDGTTALVDPMCGAGTFLVEGALLARRVAPGLGRRFACEAWPALDPARAAAVRAEVAAAATPDAAPTLVGSDVSAEAIAAARDNAARAGVGELVRLSVARLAEAQPPPGPPGLVVVNPPYGRRVGDPRRLTQLWSELGRTLRRFRGWRAGVLVPDKRLLAPLGATGPRKPRAEHALFHGGLRVTLVELAL